VIYGDTDSLFVRLDAQGKAEALANEINAWWTANLEKEHRLKSWLELRVDSLYAKFIMPTLRGSDRGSKKRYAGLTSSGELVIKGLEAVRTDWTALARNSQRELFRRVFAGEPWRDWVLGLRRELEAGKHDAELLYRKRLRREVADYASEAPHVRAAKLAAEAASEGEATATEVEYLMTVNGPEPLNALTSRLDYAHYLDKQLAPALDVVLRLLGTSFEREAGEQLSLF
jgi:DNA polymerase-2